MIAVGDAVSVMEIWSRLVGTCRRKSRLQARKCSCLGGDHMSGVHQILFSSLSKLDCPRSGVKQMLPFITKLFTALCFSSKPLSVADENMLPRLRA
jgi:hypothetical protein